MKWDYFLKVRKLNIKKHFTTRNISSKKEIIDYLNKNNFTFTEDEVDNIYDTIKPTEKEKPKIRKSEKEKLPVLSQKKKSLRSSPRKRKKRHVSGSMDSRRKNWRMVFFLC